MTLGKYTPNDHKWFNFDCRTARRKYHFARKSYSLNKNPEDYEYLSNEANSITVISRFDVQLDVRKC